MSTDSFPELRLGGDGLAVLEGIGVVVALYDQFTDTLQVVTNFRQRAFSGLGQGNTIVGITHGLVQASNLGGHTF